MNFKLLFTLIIYLTPIYLISQDERKLNKKEANEEVKRLTILTENLQSEKEELNNKLMIEYEKLLSEMDENSNLRVQNGEFRSEAREKQEQLLDSQKKISKKENEIEKLNNEIRNYKSKLLNDSLSIEKIKTLNTNLQLQFATDSVKIKKLQDSIININYTILNLEKTNESLLENDKYFSLLLYLDDGGVIFENDEWWFKFHYLDEENNIKKDFHMQASPVNQVILKGSLKNSTFYGWEDLDELDETWVRKELYKVSFALDICGYETSDICYKLIQLELAADLNEEELRQTPDLYLKTY
tara:strand:- start:388 stop:1284 length:897 start_codon:yes stop_codon:yes gene_type:complete